MDIGGVVASIVVVELMLLLLSGDIGAFDMDELVLFELVLLIGVDAVGANGLGLGDDAIGAAILVMDSVVESVALLLLLGGASISWLVGDASVNKFSVVSVAPPQAPSK
jgi:hypothetical protein